MTLACFLRVLAHQYPLYSGYGRIANLIPFKRAIGGDTAPRWVNLRSGPQILTPLNDWVGRALYYFGDLDPKLSWICKRLLRPGDTMLDIGANIGVMSLVGRALVGSNGTVHAFEPQPALAELLRKSTARNGYANVHIHQCALGAEDAILDLAIPDSNLGAASLIRSLSEYNEVIRVPVPVKQTSAYLGTLALGKIRLVKMDVEGFEPEVIKGGLRYFEGNRPDAIVFELSDHSVPFFEQPVTGYLKPLGYAFFNIPKAYWRMRVEPLLGKDQSYEHDILAIATGDTYIDAARRLDIAVVH